MKKESGTILLITAIVFLFAFQVNSQQTLAEKLGYDATNSASASGGITSGSIMVPCPWFLDFAEYYKSHPDLDVGIHITLTSEWDHYEFGGVLPSTEIPSLLDKNGYFYPTTEEVGLHADPVEAEKEIRAQIDRAIAYGITPTHIDTHMGSVLAKPELVQIYMKLGKEYKLPVFAPRMLQVCPKSRER